MPELSEPDAVRRCWDRLGFGLPALHGRPGIDLDTTLAALLSPPDAGAADADAGVVSTPLPELKPPPEPVKDPGPEQRRQRAAIRRSNRRALSAWWLGRMVAVRQPLPERMAWYWHGHFATSLAKVADARLMATQYQTMRRLGLGSFTELAAAMIVDPAMLVWLDGNDNTADAPNENLARETMELFTLGPGHYTEDDVKSAARALSGWRLQRSDPQAEPTARFVPRRHADGDLTVLGVTGPLDAAGFVARALDQPASPGFVITRIWRRLVAETPPDEATLATLVEAYGDDRDLASLIRAITTTPAFGDDASTLVKQPVEWLVGLIRTLGATDALPPAMARTAPKALASLGQVPFAPPDVAGWPQGRTWLTSATAAARLQAARALVGGVRAADLVTATGADARIDEAAQTFGVGRWGPTTRQALIAVADDPVSLLALAAASPEYVVSR